MNKCLVTTLKASTNNEALSKYNVLTIKTKSTDSPTIDTQYVGIYTGNGTVSINSSNVGLYQSGISGALRPYPQTVSALSNLDSRFENKDGVIEVTGKYNLIAVRLGASATVRIREIYGIPATIEMLVLNNIEEEEIDATKLYNAINRNKLTSLRIPWKNVINLLSKNTVEEFKAILEVNRAFCQLFDNLGMDDLANMKLSNIQFNPFLKEGNLSSLAKLTNLTAITFAADKQNNGDIMDFINPWIQAGRTSGKIRIYYLLTQKNITLNGSPISYPSGVTNSTAYLNWTSDGTVTFTAS